MLYQTKLCGLAVLGCAVIILLSFYYCGLVLETWHATPIHLK